MATPASEHIGKDKPLNEENDCDINTSCDKIEESSEMIRNNE